MAIAANFRKYPQALALQMPLPFGRLLRWATSRPTTTVLRAIRAERGRTFAELGRIAYPVAKAIPQWWKDAQKKARAFAKFMKEAQTRWSFAPSITTEEFAAANPYRRNILRSQIARGEITLIQA